MLLLPIVFQDIASWDRDNEQAVTLVPNFNDLCSYEPSPTMLNPRSLLEVCLRWIARSELVVGSSLNGIVVAESLSDPGRAIASNAGDPPRYQDYDLGTARPNREIATTTADRLLDPFPLDLWMTA